jgi:BON domain
MTGTFSGKETVMIKFIALGLVVAVVSGGLAGCSSNGQTPPPPPPPTGGQADAMKNGQEVGYTEPNQLRQGESQSDLDATAGIERRLSDRQLSVDALNIKVATFHGQSTLVGHVASRDQKDEIGRLAGDVVGQENVNNQIIVDGQ